MGKQKKIKQMRRQFRENEIKPPPTLMTNTREKHYVKLDQAFEMFPDKDKAELAVHYAKCLANGMPGIPVWMPVQLATNHKRRIKEAFLNGGYSKVELYYDHIKQIIQDNIEAAKNEHDGAI